MWQKNAYLIHIIGFQFTPWISSACIAMKIQSNNRPNTGSQYIVRQQTESKNNATSMMLLTVIKGGIIARSDGSVTGH